VTFDQIINMVQARRSGNGWISKCPAHADVKPSLSIAEGDDGRILLKCFANCTIESICEALKISVADLFSNNGHHHEQSPKTSRPKTPKPDPAKFEGSEKTVDELQLGLVHSEEGQRYIESRGISLTIAAELKWGFAPSWPFIDAQGHTVRKPALAIPHSIADKLVGIKFRTIDGTKLFSQMPGSSVDGLYGRPLLDESAPDVLIVEGPEDCALAHTHAFNTLAINSASAKASEQDIKTMRRFKRIFLLGDQDPAGQKAMVALAQRLPADQVIRVRMTSFKDVGDLWKAAPAAFPAKLRRILRFAQGSRDHFRLEDLLDEDEITLGEDMEKYAVDKLVPCYAISMFFGEEKSGKSLLSRYIGKCIANELKVFGKYPTRKMAALCLDLENNSQDIRAFTKHFARLGPGKIRYRTRQTGVPALDSPALLQLCESEHPLIILDSMTKFLNGANPFHPGEMSAFFDKLLNLCSAGATIFLIHHATRADVERYANSHQIGANVARAFAVVSEDRPYLNRVRLEGQLFRGGEPITENLVAFPVIAEAGMFGLSESSDPFGAELQKLVEFVKSQPGRACRKETIKKRPGKRAAGNLELLDLAIKRGLLVVGKDKKITFPDSGTPDTEDFPFPQSGTDGNAGYEN
jgi:5S rRNA maturation endonuclease (ribonuclease M5)